MPSFGKPVLVKWDTTERPERIAADTLELLGMEEETIYRVFTRLLGNKTENNAPPTPTETATPANGSRLFYQIAARSLKKGDKSHADKKNLGLALLFCFLLVPLCIISDSVLYAAAMFALLLWSSRRLELSCFPILLFLTALGLRVAAIFLIPTPPSSDFSTMLNAARQLNNGDTSYLEGTYFQLWAYQLGFVAFEALLLKIQDSVYILKLVNCLAGAGTTLLIYLLALELTDKRAARVAGLFYCLYPMGVLYMTVLSNQVFHSFLILAGIYCLVSERFHSPTWVRFAVFGLLLSLANLLRPESIIPLTATGISLVLLLRKSNWKQSLVYTALMLGVYFGINILINLIFQETGLAPQGLVNNAPYWKFVLGFNHDTFGCYTKADLPLLADPEAAWKTVFERLDVHPSKLYYLFERKIRVFWGNSALYWVFNAFLSDGLPLFGDAEKTAGAVTILNGLNCWFHFVCYVFTLLGVVRLIRTDQLQLAGLVLLNTVFVTFGVFLLIEVQPRYSFFAQAVCCALGAPGFSLLEEIFQSRRKTESLDVPQTTFQKKR